jgi:hypothetical protein
VKLGITLFHAVLNRYGKRAIFRTGGDSESLTIDCYDDHDPPLLAPCTIEGLADAAVFLPTKTVQTQGSVHKTEYTIDFISSHDIARVLSMRNLIDVVLSPQKMAILTVSVRSVGIVGGLHDQLATSRIQYCMPRSIRGPVRFKPRSKHRRW